MGIALTEGKSIYAKEFHIGNCMAYITHPSLELNINTCRRAKETGVWRDGEGIMGNVELGPTMYL